MSKPIWFLDFIGFVGATWSNLRWHKFKPVSLQSSEACHGSPLLASSSGWLWGNHLRLFPPSAPLGRKISKNVYGLQINLPETWGKARLKKWSPIWTRKQKAGAFEFQVVMSREQYQFFLFFQLRCQCCRRDHLLHGFPKPNQETEKNYAGALEIAGYPQLEGHTCLWWQILFGFGIGFLYWVGWDDARLNQNSGKSWKTFIFLTYVIVANFGDKKSALTHD